MNTDKVMRARWGVVLSIFCGVMAYADTHELSRDHPSYQHHVQGGVGVPTESHSYNLDVPDGYVAKVRLAQYGNGMGARHCNQFSFVQKVNGERRGLLGQTTEFYDDTRIDLSMTASDPSVSWTEIYVDHYYPLAGALAPHLASRYHFYETYEAACDYTISVTYEKLIPDLVVSSVELSSYDAAVDETVSLSYVIRNIGRLGTGIGSTVRIYDGNVQICGDQAISAVASGSSVVRTVVLPTLAAGMHTLRVVADAGNTIEEGSEVNNESTVSLRDYTRTPVVVFFDMNGVSKVGQRTVIAGNAVGTPLPDVSRRGYVFNGWWTERMSGYQISATEKITRERTFYAHWSAMSSRIVLNRQGGHGGDSVITATFDLALPLASVPSRLGYQFKGYWTERNGQGVQYYDECGKGVRTWNSTLSEATLYAYWEAAKSVVMLDAQGGTGGTKQVQTVFEQNLTAVTPPSRQGWVFQGYYSSSNGVGIVYYDASGNGVCVWDQLNEEIPTLYAYWLPIQMDYRLSFDLTGGDGGSHSLIVRYGAIPSGLVLPKRDGHVFEGFYSEPNGGGVQYFDAVGIATQKWDRAEDVLLYAKWSKAYHVQLHPNGATGSSCVQYFTEQTWKLAANAFKSNGCVFAGWALEPNGVPVFADGQIVNRALLKYGTDPDEDEVTLYAKWGMVLPNEFLPGVTFIGGSEDPDAGWTANGSSYSSRTTSSRCWLTAVLPDRGELGQFFSSKKPQRLSSGELFTVDVGIIHAKDSVVVTEECDTRTVNASEAYFENGSLVDMPAGPHLVVWYYNKALSLSDWGEVGRTTDLEKLSVLNELKGELFSEIREQICSRVMLLLHEGQRWGAIWTESDESSMRSAINSVYSDSSMGIGDPASYMCSKLASKGFNTTCLQRDLNKKGGYEDSLSELCRKWIKVYDDRMAIRQYVNGSATVNNLFWKENRTVVFLNDGNARYEEALQASDRVDSCTRDLYDVVYPGIVSLVTPFMQATTKSGYWNADYDSKVQRAVSDAINHWIDRNFWGYSHIADSIVSLLASAGMDVSILKSKLDSGSSDGRKIRDACEEAEVLIEERERLRQFIKDCGVMGTRTVTKGSMLGSLLDPGEVAGCDFVGWWTAPTGGTEVDAQTVVADDLVLYRHWTVKTFEVNFDANGGSPNCKRTIEYGLHLGELPTCVRSGYSFAAWVDQEHGGTASILSASLYDITYVAEWTKITDWRQDDVPAYEWHDDWEGESDEREMKDDDEKINPTQPVEPPVEPPEEPIGPETPINVPPTVVDESETHVDAEKGEVALYETVVAVYDGYLYDAKGVVWGSVQVKVAKGKVDRKTGAFSAKTTATVQLADGSRKISFKNGVADAAGNVTGLTAAGHTLDVSLGVNGISGTMDGHSVDGARNVFSAKDAASKATAAAIEKQWVGAINVVGDGVVLSVTVARKGKVKVSGTVDGVKVSATSQLLVGAEACCIPVVITKKAKVAFNLWLRADGGVEAAGLDGATAGRAGALKSGAVFRMDGAALARALPGLYGGYLPGGLSVAPSGAKWVVAGGAKAGKLKLVKGTSEIDREKSKFTGNMPGLKLTYKAKDGSFKGSFKAYALENGKIKSYTVNVTGVMVGDVGYGEATLKKPTASWPVTIE